MADYFAILAARLSGAADALRPVRPAHFEPVLRRPPIGLESEQLSPTEAVTDLIETDEEVVTSGRPPPMPRRSIKRNIAAREPALNESFLAPDDHLPARLDEVATPVQASTEITSASGDSGAAIPPGNVQQSAALDSGLLTRSETSNAVKPNAPNDTSGAVNSVDESSSKPVRPVVVRVVERESFHRSWPDELRHPSAVRNRKAAHGKRNETASSASPPAIQITIGRIEVQAVLPAPASLPAPARPPASLLKLETYLARRNSTEG